MLPKENRLKKKKDFEHVFKEGKGVKEDFLFLKFFPNKLKQSRFGVVVSQKISKKAVTRNKLKRRIKKLIELNLPKIKRGKDVVLVALPGLEARDIWEIEKTINNLFKKSKIVND